MFAWLERDARNLCFSAEREVVLTSLVANKSNQKFDLSEIHYELLLILAKATVVSL